MRKLFMSDMRCVAGARCAGQGKRQDRLPLGYREVRGSPTVRREAGLVLRARLAINYTIQSGGPQSITVCVAGVRLLGQVLKPSDTPAALR